MMTVKYLFDQGFKNVIIFLEPSYDGCIEYVTEDNRAVYNYSAMIQWCMDNKNMTEDEAIDWVDDNAVGAYVENGPIINFDNEEDY